MEPRTALCIWSLWLAQIFLIENIEAKAQNKDSTAINETDVIARLDPKNPIQSQTWSGLNCFGKYPNLSKLTDSGVAGPVEDSQNQMRFGRTADPLDPSRIAFIFNVYASDPLTAGAKRCEALAPPTADTAIPRARPFWYAFRILLWRGAEVQSGRAMLTQWHVHGFNPFFGLVIKDGYLSFTARYNQRPGGKKSDLTTLELWRDDAPVQRRWMTFVVQANVSPHADEGPFIRIWRDGQLLVDRAGPLGYIDNGLAYAKIGYYHWLNDNPWDDSKPERTVFVSNAVLVRDERRRYTELQLRQLANE